MQRTQKTEHRENKQHSWKWAMELNRELSKEEIQIAKKEMYRYSPSLAIREMQEKKHTEISSYPSQRG